MFLNQLQKNCLSNDNKICETEGSGDHEKCGCGEVKTLDVLKEFQQLYENKLSEIEDDSCQCSGVQLKIQMLREWVNDLTEQNTLLVQVVEELETEASKRVTLLEEKLKSSSKTSYEIMKNMQDYDKSLLNQSDYNQKLKYYQNDINSLMEFIKRVRETGNWNKDGLNFCIISPEELRCSGDFTTGTNHLQNKMADSMEKLKCELDKAKKKQEEYERIIESQEKKMEELNELIDNCNKPNSRLFDELHELRAELKQKTEDNNRLQMSVKDTRESLTAEVADKHDALVLLRHECQMLEERCRQADKQTHFKDDIIKEMRKELKQYRSKCGELENLKTFEEFKNRMSQLEDENVSYRKTFSVVYEELNQLHFLINKFNRENEDFYNSLQNHVNLRLFSTDDYIMLQNTSSSETVLTVNSTGSINDHDVIRSLFILKSDINKFIYFMNEQGMNELKKKFGEIENNLYDIENKEKLIKNKDEMIQIQNDSLSVAQKEIQELKEKMSQLEEEREIRLYEIRNLQQALQMNQNTIEELSSALRNSEEKGNKNKEIVEVYVDTIQLLENAKQKAQTEIEQQRVTIGNLQEALINVKQQLENLQGRSSTELKEKKDTIYELNESLSILQSQYQDCYDEVIKVTQAIEVQRDSNLQLKVINTELQTDNEELNEKISKYLKNNKVLEETVQRLQRANNSLENDVAYMRNEMEELSKQLKTLQELLKIGGVHQSEDINLNLAKSLHILEAHSETLIEQLKITQHQVAREMKINETSNLKIEQLEKQLDQKSQALQCCENEIQEAKHKLSVTMEQIVGNVNKVASMEQQIIEYKASEDCIKNETIVSTCNSDLIYLKQKIDVLNNILHEKSNEILKLHAELSYKSDTIARIVNENKELKLSNTKCNQEAKNMEYQLEMYKKQCKELSEKYNNCKSQIDLLQSIETSSQEELRKEKRSLHERLDASKQEEVRYTSLINNLKLELEETKLKLKLKDADIKELQSTQAEVLTLKEDINKITKARNRIITENKSLLDQLSTLNQKNTQLENRNEIISQQLEKCIQELTDLQCVKNKIEERNFQLQSEMDHLQRSFAELNQEFIYKNESVMNLEQELSEAKICRHEICTESRIVVNNVKAWLDEQKQINIRLKKSIKDKNSIIKELTLERALLLKNIKEVCERYEVLSEELQVCRQYLADINLGNPRKSSKQLLQNTWGSQGSIPYYESTTPDYYGENTTELAEKFSNTHEETLDEDHPKEWMRKVQNMSEDLQKSKHYFETKLSLGDKRVKPVKDVKANSLC